jgi:hypothetical protein
MFSTVYSHFGVFREIHCSQICSSDCLQVPHTSTTSIDPSPRLCCAIKWNSGKESGVSSHADKPTGTGKQFFVRQMRGGKLNLLACEHSVRARAIVDAIFHLAAPVRLGSAGPNLISIFSFINSLQSISSTRNDAIFISIAVKSPQSSIYYVRTQFPKAAPKWMI